MSKIILSSSLFENAVFESFDLHSVMHIRYKANRKVVKMPAQMQVQRINSSILSDFETTFDIKLEFLGLTISSSCLDSILVKMTDSWLDVLLLTELSDASAFHCISKCWVLSTAASTKVTA